MKENFRIYYYFIIGAIGGLTGWFLSTLLASAFKEGTLESQILFGGFLGAIIGISVAAYDGLSNRSLARLVKYGSVGLLLGAIAGAAALPLAQNTYNLLLSSVKEGESTASAHPMWKFLIGTVCWIFFGGLIGLGEGIGKGTQFWKGMLGGVAGGLIGGIIYESFRSLGGATADLNLKDMWSQVFLAVSFALLGAAVSASIAFVTSALKSAWFEVLDGKLSGRTYDVTKYVDPKLGGQRSGIIGSDEWSSHIYLPGDNEILAHHAEINFSNGAPTITASPEAAKRMATIINGRRLINSSPLSNGDRIQVGSTSLIYRNKS